MGVTAGDDFTLILGADEGPGVGDEAGPTEALDRDRSWRDGLEPHSCSKMPWESTSAAESTGIEETAYELLACRTLASSEIVDPSSLKCNLNEQRQVK